MKYIFLNLIFIMGCQQTVVVEPFHAASDNTHFTRLATSQTCSSCHQEIYQQWSESIHAQSSYFQDPIHKAVVDAYQTFRLKNGKPKDYHCANCHTPMASNREELMQATAQLDQKNPTHQEGVSCRTCHNMIGVESNTDFDRPIYGKDSIVYGNGSYKKVAPHPVKKFAFKDKNSLCLSCHAHKHNSQGVGICVMAQEQKGSKCIDCHMPVDEKLKVRSHHFFGSRNKSFIKNAVSLKLKIKKNNLDIILQSNIGHEFPSSQPMRQAAIIIRGFDVQGKQLWTNENELSPLDKTLMMVALESKDGKFPVPPWMANKQKFDTRLKALETRKLSFKLSSFSKETKKIHVDIKYRLLAPAMAKNFNIEAKYANWEDVISESIIL